MQLSMGISQKATGFEIRALVRFEKEKFDGREQYFNAMRRLHAKLEQVMPGVYSAKFTMSGEDLIVTMKTEKQGDALALRFKLEEYIKTAAMALKV